MKSSEFLSALRMIIREEVTYAVRKEMKTLMNEGISQQEPAYQEPIVKAAPKAKKPLFKDPMLNELLSNVGTVTQDYGSEEPWPTMQYNSSARTPLSRAFTQPTKINAAPAGTSIEAIEKIAPDVAKALTRDYRSLIKAIDKKKGG